ncbi:unnamed protein product [Bemisia tabaci]|uniref:Peptidase C1A papain C-terminal domain-containing protein n=1 Tax=Bemisia tabaci TaxID=7038 RepID=A0A9P0AHV6_BEMTA|nr:unnamed protein product [Bemisia tabaci]
MCLADILFVIGVILVQVTARDIASMDLKKLSFKDTDAMINYINNAQSSWIAGKNFPDDISEDYLKRLSSAPVPQIDRLPKLPIFDDFDDSEAEFGDTYEISDPPAEFDARKQWANCPSVSHVYDQGNCGSCWAVAVASVITDRICINTKGASNDWISSWEIASCCVEDKCGTGCFGGYASKAFEFYVKHGVVTGGEFGSNEGCMPYMVKPCSHRVVGKYPDCRSYNNTVLPTCQKQCINPNYKTSMDKDRHFGKRSYEVKVADLKKELSKKGPVTMWFNVNEDFRLYKSGVYFHVTGAKVGGHIVRVLGYGTENGINYWLCANSWNPEWGDKGLFKIKSGSNESGCEESLFAAEPKVKT